jgi:transposase InsO family protein
MRYEFIKKHSSAYAVERMCRILGVTRSGYYCWLRRGLNRRQKRDRALLEQIRKSYRQNNGRAGSPRVHEDLLDWGYCTSRKRVARLMREAGLRAKTKRKFRVTTQSKHSLPVADNLLGRDFTVKSPNKVWVSDITYLWTREGWQYLCVVLDLFNRQVVGWNLSHRLMSELAEDALIRAVMRRRPSAGLVFHSDRGVQYCSRSFRKLLKRYGMVQSMSRKGDCWDNAVAESFFGTLKRELVYHETYRTRAEARLSVFQYIEAYYNRRRRHSALGYLSPIEFEQVAMVA